jgi:hypothetical protein
MIMVIGNLRSIMDYVHSEGLTRGTYVPVYVRKSHEALRGRSPEGLVIVYVEGADLVLDQPGVRGFVGMLVGLGARELVAR